MHADVMLRMTSTVTRRLETNGRPLKSHVTRGAGDALYGSSKITVSPSFSVNDSWICSVENSGAAGEKQRNKRTVSLTADLANTIDTLFKGLLSFWPP